jgi:universal stress protein A
MAIPLPGLKRILVSIDYSSTGDRALAWAVLHARTFAAELIVLHVIERGVHFGTFGYSETPGTPELSGDHARLEAHLREKLGDSGLVVRALVEVGDSAFKIREVAKRDSVDLIVIGTHGKSGIGDLLFSSVEEKIIHHTGCPVLTVPPTSEEEEG